MEGKNGERGRWDEGKLRIGGKGKNEENGGKGR